MKFKSRVLTLFRAVGAFESRALAYDLFVTHYMSG